MAAVVDVAAVVDMAVVHMAGLAVVDMAGLAVLDMAQLAGTHSMVAHMVLAVAVAVAVVLVVAELVEILVFQWLMLVENCHHVNPEVNTLEHLVQDHQNYDVEYQCNYHQLVVVVVLLNQHLKVPE